ncbi:hypothetical protein [Streptoalloteichus hindustanus]|uniref:Uncharacterized protein n=1 Tax=Streptoalloteichus hindustanus TaxID=2017 RepID=A0A1M5PCM2_STRHI|nr:hypothetical protein [Streptoalloteichus hindustanus]SHG99561.1 hypothetical protein SAMN05444320_11812 [Streptoalloteichus hindustanus]
MNATDQAAISAFPELAHLIALRNGGWRFLPPVVRDGRPVEVDGFREWPGGDRDMIGVRSPSEVLGLRVTGDEPPGLVWEHTGSLAEVVRALLTLPPPGTRTAPRLVVAAGPPLWTPDLAFGPPS